jgi:hypothetical protein
MKLRLTKAAPKRPRHPGLAIHTLYRVHVGASGKTVSLKQFCDKAGISYASCRTRIELARIDDYDSSKFHEIVADMLRRKQRLGKRLHDCPHCRCVRGTETKDEQGNAMETEPAGQESDLARNSPDSPGVSEMHPPSAAG